MSAAWLAEEKARIAASPAPAWYESIGWDPAVQRKMLLQHFA